MSHFVSLTGVSFKEPDSSSDADLITVHNSGMLIVSTRLICIPSVCPSVRYQLISGTCNPIDAKHCTHTPWMPTMNLCHTFSRIFNTTALHIAVSLKCMDCTGVSFHV